MKTAKGIRTEDTEYLLIDLESRLVARGDLTVTEYEESETEEKRMRTAKIMTPDGYIFVTLSIRKDGK